MKIGLFAFLLGASVLSAPSVRAEPVLIDRTAALAKSRFDAGTGLCATSVHYLPQATPLSMLSQASELLGKHPLDASLQGRSVFRLDRVNLRNALAGSEGDFTSPSFPDRSFPFSSDPGAMPVGDDVNIAVRLRGYLNVRDARGGLPVTFALHCNDACSLSIGGQAVIAQTGAPASARVTRQVVFPTSGLYPIEVLYYQNSGSAHLELARALSAEPEGNQSSALDPARFQPIPTADLFSDLAGENANCRECVEASRDCAPGSACSNGLCQGCHVPAFCGASCQQCPTTAPICNGRCVECVANDQCPSGQNCYNSRCSPPIVCRTHEDCPSPYYCEDRDGCGTRTCGSVYEPCTNDVMCTPGTTCISGRCWPPMCPAPPEAPKSGGCTAPSGGAAETQGVASGGAASLLLCVIMLLRRRLARCRGRPGPWFVRHDPAALRPGLLGPKRRHGAYAECARCSSQPGR